MEDKKIEEYKNHDDDSKVTIKLERYRWPDEIAQQRRKRRLLVVVVVAVFFSFALGWQFSNLINNGENAVVDTTSSEIAQFERVYNDILNNWYFAGLMENPEEELINNAIKGMLELNGDIHTSYMTSDEVLALVDSINMNFEGIGVQYYPGDGINLITRVFKGSPAEEYGVLAGDILYSVDGVLIADMESDEIGDRIMGPSGTEVKLVVLRQQELVELNIVRGQINALTWGEMLTDEIGYLEIASFGTSLVESATTYMDYFLENGATQLIIDLRDNGGGYLDAIDNIAQLFFDNNDVVYQEERTGGVLTHSNVSSSRKSQYPFEDIVILINENSASASEVLALAMMENLGVKTIGVTSYGKGTVQIQQNPYPDNSILKVTIAKWMSPNGVNIDGVGIVPDYEVKLADIFYQEYVTFAEDEVVNYDSVHDGVAYVQKALSFLGYHSGREDGYYDSATLTALNAYQADVGMDVTDQIDQDTINQMYSSVIYEWTMNKAEKDVQLHQAIEVLENGG